MIARILVTAVALLSPFGTAATAHADVTDTRFLATLQREGITDQVSPEHAINAAHTVCEKLDRGLTPNEVVSDVLNSSNMPAYHSGYFVGASIDNYCPQYRPEETPEERYGG